MADTSPGKVQALRAMFTQKESPVMGLMPPSGKLGTRPWKRSLSSLTEDSQQQSKDDMRTSVNASATRAIFKTLQDTDVTKNGEVKNINSDTPCDKLCKVPHKPIVGPKPLFVKQQCRTVSSPALNLSSNLETNKRYENSVPPTRTKNGSVEFRKNYDTIASFMFVESPNNTAFNKSNSDSHQEPLQNSIIGNCDSKTEVGLQTKNIDSCLKIDSKLNSRLSLINSDNYICKSSCNFIRSELPPKEKIGPPPLKPVKPPHMKLPEKFCAKKILSSTFEKSPVPEKPARPSLSPPLPILPVPQKPTYPCPPRPTTSPPVPPVSQKHISSLQSSSNSNLQSKSLLEEIEELYEDTLLQEMSHRPVSLIPEYTAEEEEAAELYDDAAEISSSFVDSTYPLKPKHPPPLPPTTTGCLDPIGNPISEELYQDAIEPSTDEFYEEMPVDMQQEDHYSNNRKELEKIRREEEKRIRKEIREKEKKEKEFDKVKKKFGLTGEELPIDAGLVKADCRGGKNDLQVKKGEVVYILRIEGNPPGKWLVRSKKGKYGYVELTNIEVDPDSVKSVMTIQRTSVISTSEELYSEAYSEEGIYEVTY